MMEQDPEKDDKSQASFRKVMETDPVQFMTTYERLEARARTKKNGKTAGGDGTAKAAQPAAEEPDEEVEAAPDERVAGLRETIARLREKWGPK